MKLSPVLAGLPPYPFAALRETRERIAAAGVEILDFGMGEPREQTPAFIREALAADPVAPYPVTGGLPELREAIAAWALRRFAVSLDPETAIIPTLGTKEAIFAMASVTGGDLVAVPSPGYPVPERGALFAGRGVLELPLQAERGFLPDLDAIDADTWARVGLLWLNYPNNPDGRDRHARALRARRGARARARLPRLLRRGLQRAVLRGRAAGLDPSGCRPHQRPRPQHAVQALGDARLPLRLRRG